MNKKIKLFLIVCLTSVFLISGSLVSFAAAPTNYTQWKTNKTITFGDTPTEASNIMWYDVVDTKFGVSNADFWTEYERDIQTLFVSNRFKFRCFMEGPGESVDVISERFGYSYNGLTAKGSFYVYGSYTNGSDLNGNASFTLFEVSPTTQQVYFPSGSDEYFDPLIFQYFDVVNGDSALTFNYADTETSHYQVFNSFFVDRIYYRLNNVVNSYSLQLFNSENTIIGNGLYDGVELLTSDSLDQVNSYTIDTLEVGQTFQDITQIEVVNNSNATLLLELFANNTSTSYTILPNESSPTIELIGDTNLYLSVAANSSQFTISGLYRFKSAFLSRDIPSLFAQINNKIDVSFTFPYADDIAISQNIYNLEYIPPITVNEEYVIYANPVSVSNDDIGLFIYDPLLNFDNYNNYYLPTAVFMNKYNIIDFGESDISVDYITYTILNKIGDFGDFEDTNGSYIENLGHFLLDSVDGFLSFRIVPGFSLYNLLTLIIAIPLLLYILKLFLGG